MTSIVYEGLSLLEPENILVDPEERNLNWV